jgi:NAD(P)-dependent dehydrogenase (short-subunit alcohol dehydrogenase family)
VLDGRLIAVAGAGGGAGPAVVARLAGAGAALALAGRDVEKLEGLAPRAGIAAVDLLDAAATRAWADGLAERHGGVDGVVHLVGGWRGGVAIEEAPLDDWDALEGSLVRTLMHVTRAFLPHLVACGHGRFVAVGAAQAQAPTQSNAVYASAKAAAEAWVLALADRLRGTGSTANLVVVRAILTPAMRAASPEKTFATFTPVEELAEAIAYLCSDAAASMNGQRLVLRGAA